MVSRPTGRRTAALAMAACAAVLGAGACGSSRHAVSFDQTPSSAVATSSTAPGSSSGSAPDTLPDTAPDTSTGTIAEPSRFETLPVGATLPTDSECAARVRPAPEVRASNASFNQNRGHATAADPAFPLFARVTGDFTGTTDEILQWAACKWGVDEDVVRAQAAKETYWTQDHLGDFGTDPARCVPGHPIGADGQPGKCPESVGLLQTRYPYFMTTIADAMGSTAYEADITYAVWRTCFEGGEQWLNTVERGQDYAPGDLWGCVGAWYAGRWYTQAAKDYIAAVQDYVDRRIWKTDDFLSFSG